MIIDVHAHLGHYPFRRLRHNTAPGLLDLMDRNGINKAVVSSLNSVFYRNVHEGNRELRAATQPLANRFVPLVTVNPMYAGWEHDLDEAILDWGWKGVYLTPSHHRYRLDDEAGKAVLQRIARHNVPVVLPQRLEDRRQQHWMDTTEDLRFEDVATALRPLPDLKVLLLNWQGLAGNRIREAGLAERVLIDMTRLSVTLRKEVPKLIGELGVGAIGFGTHMPMAYPGPALVKLQIREFLSPADRERIAWRNAADFLGIKDESSEVQ
ncbi:MAG: amidohydrolase family protein [Fuerstiella sp.]|nr:amidohydrolase family protein [Fuerstiella sp.]MCP4855129.1 amidohydrolase family protein [Fuerstiella sp.]